MRRPRPRFGAAGRIAFFPARAAARASREQLGAAAVPELSKLADRAFASDLPEELARSIADQHVLERVVSELARTGAIDRAIEQALASPHTKEAVERIIHSPEVKQAIKEVIASREVRIALAEQSAGVAEELASDIRTQGVALDERIERLVRRRTRPLPAKNAGLASRALAGLVDALAIAVIFALFGAALALISYLVGGIRPKWLVEALLGGGWAVVAATYLVVFWNGSGRTPGMHLMHLRLRDASGKWPSISRALVRVVATWISIVPLFLGYVPVLFDERRRGVPDLVTGTEVVYETR